MHTNPAAFGELLRRYRLAAGLSQEALAERAGISPDAVRALEKGRSKAPRGETLNRLAAALGLGAEAQAALRAAALGMPAPAPGDQPAPPEPADGQAAGHPLPVPLSSFVGREHERAAVRGLLARARLVTLTGAGGVGKTRLALTVAGELADAYREGVWLVELAALADPGLVAGAVLRALGLREELGRPHPETLAAFLQRRQLLLVLDNCEHLLGACAALVVALLRACPELRVLATSREGLGVSGEQRYRVPSLRVPDLVQLPAVEAVLTYEAVRLFVERAQERQADFGLDARTAPVAAAVCARLDGIPLAIELAAARVSSLPIADIAARLDRSLELLTRGPRDLPSRQQTLRATLDWSWALLSNGEQTLLRRLAIFRGGWTLEAAEAVCSGNGIDADDMLDLQSGLINKSLVVADDAFDAARCRIPEAVREYAMERLATSGEALALRGQHLDWCVRLAAEASTALEGARQSAWLERLESDLENLRAALAASHDGAGAAVALRLAASLAPFWAIRSHLPGSLREGRDALEAALAQAARERGAEHVALDPFLWASAAQWCARLHELLGDYDRALDWIDRLLADAAMRVTREAAESLITAGLIDTRRGEFARARERAERAADLAHSLGAPVTLARAFGLHGIIANRQGNSEHASAHLRQALALYQQTGQLQGQGLVHNELANTYAALGQWQDAADHYRQAYDAFRQLKDTYNAALAANNLGEVARTLGQFDSAQAFYEEAASTFEHVGAKPYVLGVVQMNLGAVAVRRGDAALAGQHLSMALAHFAQAQSRDFLPETHRLLAEAALLSGDSHGAEEEAQQACTLARSLTLPGEEGSSLRVLGLATAATGNLDRAEQHLQESIRVLHGVSDTYEEARSCVALARVYHMLRRTLEARSTLADAMHVFRLIDARADLADAESLQAALVSDVTSPSAP